MRPSIDGYGDLVNVLLMAFAGDPEITDHIKTTALRVFNTFSQDHEEYVEQKAATTPTVVPDPPDSVIPPSTPSFLPGLDEPDFVAALQKKGYEGNIRDLASFGLVDLNSQSEEVLRRKMEAILALPDPHPVAPASSGWGVAAAPAPSPSAWGSPASQATDVSVCPNWRGYGSTAPNAHDDPSQGYANERKDGNGTWYKCRIPGCVRPDGTATTWDAKNYASRIEEFKTGRPAPKRTFGTYRR